MIKLREDKGFTLIELMVVILIIAILMAVGIPAFLGARGRAQDNVAKQAIMNVAKNVAAQWAATAAHTIPAAADFGTQVESSYAFSALAAAPAWGTIPVWATPFDIGVYVNGDDVTLGVESEYGNKFTVAITNGQVGTVTQLAAP
ncbi:MAG: type II secretion system protein [Actinobacteria bacterium]|nr:MAG: type II secretion system protein [Actinomycetota bacterium]